MTTPTIKVGFIGLGIMGASMARNIQRAGYQLVVHDIRPEAASELIGAGAIWAESPKLLMQSIDVLFTCLPGAAEIENVLLGSECVFEGARPGQACFEMSTNTPELVKKLHARFQTREVDFLDAPISGGAKGAQLGRMAIWVGGSLEVFNQYSKLLQTMGDKIVHVGVVGSGLVTKLVHNCASQSMQAALAEVFAMGVKAGAEPLKLWEAIRQGSIGRRRTFDGLIDEYLPAKFSPPNATLKTVHKDMLISTELARNLGVPMRFANLALADITEAMNLGWQDLDARSVMRLPQIRAGIEIKVDTEEIKAVLKRDPAAPTDAKHGIMK